MAINSKYFDNISIKKTKKVKKEAERFCAFKDCTKAGAYKAPLGANAPGQYIYFCLEHVREYNKNFNFFENLPEKEREKIFDNCAEKDPFPRRDQINLTHARFSPHISNIRSGSAVYQKRIGNIYNCVNSNYAKKFTPLELKAFATLSLSTDSTAEQIKAKYKHLVKIHHPDANAGDRSTEDRFNDIVKAYNLLKKNGIC